MKQTQTWGSVTRFDAGRVLEGEHAVMLRLHFRAPTPAGQPPAPEQTTPALYLTETHARDLLLLLAHTLGLPGTGIEPTKLPTQ